MTTNKNPQPLVPGTRKRRGAKNHLLKSRKDHQKDGKIESREIQAYPS